MLSGNSYIFTTPINRNMRRIIHRSAKAVAFSSSDEDNEDDAFTALSKKQKKVPGKSSTNDDSNLYSVKVRFKEDTYFGSEYFSYLLAFFFFF